jgi:hypothetical protein
MDKANLDVLVNGLSTPRELKEINFETGIKGTDLCEEFSSPGRLGRQDDSLSAQRD